MPHSRKLKPTQGKQISPGQSANAVAEGDRRRPRGHRATEPGVQAGSSAAWAPDLLRSPFFLDPGSSWAGSGEIHFYPGSSQDSSASESPAGTIQAPRAASARRPDFGMKCT